MPPSPKVDMSTNQILARLPEKESKRLLPHLQFVSLRLKEVLYRPGEPIQYAYFPQNAVLSMIAPMDDGRSVEVTLIGHEGMMGIRAILGAETHWYDSVVQIPGGCLRIDAKVLQTEFRRGGVLQERLLHFINYLLVQLSQTAACNRIHRLEQRLARWLLMAHDRVKQDEFPMTHEFLSSMLGAPRSEVSIAAGALRKSGVIRYARGKMTIVDRKGLQSAACECYQILHDELYYLR
jgi:CRP-like cAMP-binding protein